MAARIVQAMLQLPDRGESALQQRMATAEADVRDTMLRLRRTLEDHAAKFTQGGYTYDIDEDAEYAVVGRTVIGRLRLVRED